MKPRSEFDARKALAQAISDLRVIGITMGILGLMPMAAGVFGRSWERYIFLAAGAAIFSPAVLAVIISVFLRKRQAWAARAAVILISAGAAVFALLLIASLFGLPYTLGIVVTMGVWLAAALILLRQLRLGLHAVHFLNEREHGFVPLMAQPVDDPPAMSDA